MLTRSKLASTIQTSATLAAGAKARQLRASGVTVYDFSLGEPDQATPEHICRAAAEAVKAGHTHYTPVAGVPELRRAIADWYGRFHGFAVDPAHVVVSGGAKQAIHSALVATVGPGDEVIIPSPYWVSYSDLVVMTGAKTVIVPTTIESGFKCSAKQIRAALTPRTKLLMLNSPCNPTGTVYSQRELEEIVDVVLESGAGILSDEIYEQLTYGEARGICVASLRPELADRAITISGASKSYAMTGWRMGWSIAPPDISKAIADIQSQEVGCSSSIGQYALLAALEGPQDCVAIMRNEYAARREYVAGRLRSIPGVKLHLGDGSFYVFFGVEAFFGRTIGGRRITDSTSFCSAALDVAHVNLVPGSAFGAEGYVRMSFAARRDQLEAGLDQLTKFLT